MSQSSPRPRGKVLPAYDFKRPRSAKGDSKDFWDKIETAAKLVGAVATPLLVIIFGTLLNSTVQSNLESMRLREGRANLYAELVSQKGASARALKKELLIALMKDYFGNRPPLPLLQKLEILEFLGENVHESVNLKPLLVALKRQTELDGTSASPGRDGTALRTRILALGRSIAVRQAAFLESVGTETVWTISKESLTKLLKGGTVELASRPRTLSGVTRSFKLTLVGAKEKRGVIKGILGASVSGDKVQAGPEDSLAQPFTLDNFTFPIVDNFRISRDQRCALVLEEFQPTIGASIKLIYFPGSYGEIVKDMTFRRKMSDLEKGSDFTENK